MLPHFAMDAVPIPSPRWQALLPARRVSPAPIAARAVSDGMACLAAQGLLPTFL
jgi:hypothetical protein